MKKNFSVKCTLFHSFLCILMLSSSYLVAQSSQKTNLAQSSIGVHLQVYSNALEVQDIATALQACHYIVAQQGSASTFRDTMAMLYYNLGSYKQSLMLGLGLLQSKTSNTALLAIVADSYAKLGYLKEAITHQEKLYSLTPQIAYGFNLLEMQLQLQRNAEGIVTANKILSSKIDSNVVYYYKDSSNNPLQTSIKAAIYNYLGTAYFKLNEKVKARSMFLSALKEDENFYLAKLNLDAVKEK